MHTTELKTQDLGALSGDLLIFGGVYSNLYALQALKQAAEQQGFTPDRIICTGDVVAYGAAPHECLALIQDWGIYTILGNVEIQLRDDLEDCGCNFDSGTRCDLFSRQWYPYARRSVTPQARAWLQTWPDQLAFTYAGRRVRVVHGSPSATAEFVFASTPWEAKAAHLATASADVLLAGHCGLPFVQVEGAQAWLNAGVIGMPANDGTPDGWYMTMHERPKAAFAVRLHRLSYDYQAAQRDMEAAALPVQYSKTLSTGIWDNCEILPAIETAAQGQALPEGEWSLIERL